MQLFETFLDSMGINETIADTRHWITEHKLKAIGQILDSLFSVVRDEPKL